MEESSNASDISGLTSHSETSDIGRFTDGAKEGEKYKNWSKKGIQMYNTITKLLIKQQQKT